eukprot:m.49212 g.49212  ORF g.49212 m.49212 type:complete len:704 (+) comp33965_c0_seq3:46-2157(+)
MISTLNASVFLVVVILTLRTRLHRIEEPPHVAWDETHFGKHANFYLNRTFFFDVHPPLGKMLLALAGYLTNYNGTFEFDKPGDTYGDHNYTGMRTFCALMGSMVVPSAYWSVYLLSKSVTAAFVASVVIILDTGTLTLSQYILLDPMLLAFISLSTCCLTFFHYYRDRKHWFSVAWWFWLAMTGLFLSCAFSVKFVGLFVILLVGLYIIWDLWDLMGDMSNSLTVVAIHFMARAFCLIVLPAMIYLTFFAVHFHILNKSGPGDAFFSSAFQSTLQGNELFNSEVPEYVAYGSRITLKNHRSGGGLLHSHPHIFPEGVGVMQQQVTAYSHKDENNVFLVKKAEASPDPDPDAPPELVHSGDTVRLEHIMTKRNLHSHVVQAPVTVRHFQVSGYGENGVGDNNDFWRIEIAGGEKGDPIRTVHSVIRLIHVNVGCALHSHDKQLPKWGWEQLEVTCNPVVRDPNNLWNVEGHVNDKLPKGSINFYKPSFMQAVIEAHKIMTQVNSNLKPKEGEVTSKPWQWAVNYRGQRFSGYLADSFRVYLLGNPVVFWSNLFWIVLFLVLFAIRSLVLQRGYVESSEVKDHRDRLSFAALFFLLGWFLHYFPFFLMGRVLYFHHYFPAFLYNSMLTGVVVEFVLSSLSNLISMCSKQRHHQKTIYFALLGLILAVLTQSFSLFSGLSYGMEGPLSDNPGSTMYNLKWLDSWEF